MNTSFIYLQSSYRSYKEKIKERGAELSATLPSPQRPSLNCTATPGISDKKGRYKMFTDSEPLIPADLFSVAPIRGVSIYRATLLTSAREVYPFAISEQDLENPSLNRFISFKHVS